MSDKSVAPPIPDFAPFINPAVPSGDTGPQRVLQRVPTDR